MSNPGNSYLVFIFGPTGVGKTDVALKLAQSLPSEIINIDVGQFYTPLSIGTAKPDWKNEPIVHHLFDIINTPEDFTVSEYRKKFLEVVKEIWKRNHLPIVVGGSAYYIYSLLFPPRAGTLTSSKDFDYSEDAPLLWEKLYNIDPKRADQINKNDLYRIKRALEIWHTTGKKPSEFEPSYDPPSPYTLICLTRDRDDLYERINSRTKQMIEAGWIDEVKSLKSTPWEPFLKTKKLIGYPEILDHIDAKMDLNETVSIIQQETRNYAKRQLVFWRRLEKQLKNQNLSDLTCIETINLTSCDLDLYIKQLSEQLKTKMMLS